LDSDTLPVHDWSPEGLEAERRFWESPKGRWLQQLKMSYALIRHTDPSVLIAFDALSDAAEAYMAHLERRLAARETGDVD
jgi:hypothetical protein